MNETLKKYIFKKSKFNTFLVQHNILNVFFERIESKTSTLAFLILKYSCRFYRFTFSIITAYPIPTPIHIVHKA